MRGSAPRPGHRRAIVQLQRSGLEQEVHQPLALLELNDLVQRGIHRLGERFRAEDVARRIDLLEVDLEGRLASRCRSHVQRIAKYLGQDSDSWHILYLTLCDVVPRPTPKPFCSVQMLSPCRTSPGIAYSGLYSPLCPT